MIKFTLAALALSWALAGQADAHDTFLWPSTFTPEIDETVTFDMGSTAAFPEMENRIAPARIAFYGISPGAFDDAAPDAAAFTLTARPNGRGAALVQAQLLARDIDLEPAEAAHYFDEISAPDSVREAYEAQGRGVLRESYSKSVHAIVCVETCEDLSGAYAGLLTYFHFRPVARDGLGQLQAFQLLYNGAPVADQPVTLAAVGSRVALRADAEGIILIPGDAHGPVLLSSTILRPPAEPGARWTSDFATLTFLAP